MNSDNKKHEGVIIGIEDGGYIVVKIGREQCDGCQLGKLCNVSSDDNIHIPVDDINDWSEGTRVIIEESTNLEKKAIWICLVIPCLIFMSVVLGISVIFSSLWGCIAGLLSLVVYYGIFYLCRGENRSNRIIYKVKKI